MSTTNSKLTRVADNIRILSAAMVEKAKSGHPGGAMGGADFITVLFTEFLRYDPDNMAYPYRDRFFLDPGHMSPMLYATLSLAGHYSTEDLQSLRQWGSVTPGHPEVDVMRGVENTSGPLGQGHAMALGAAIAERFMAARFGEWMAHKTYAYISDGAVEEEISQGVGRIAGHLGLSNFVMYYDSNNIQLSTKVDEVMTENVAMKYEAWGWNVLSIDGHNINEIREALVAAESETERPTLIIGHTVMGKGAKGPAGESFENKVSTHGQPLTAAGADFAATVKNLGGDAENPFAVFAESREVFAERREALKEWAAKQAAVEKSWRAEHKELARKLDDFLSGKLPEIDYKSIEMKADVATRAASATVLGVFAEKIDNMIVASADLSNSDKTDGYLKKTKAFTKGDFSGKFFQAGVSELTMACVANGMALHGGVIPVCGTFFVFSDYMKPAVRLSALMRLHVVYVWTHDSFRVGEDGPTHQPVEHEAQIRLMEHLRNHHDERSMLVLRPADGDETVMAWKLAVEEHRAVAPEHQDPADAGRHPPRGGCAGRQGRLCGDGCRQTRRGADRHGFGGRNAGRRRRTAGRRGHSGPCGERPERGAVPRPAPFVPGERAACGRCALRHDFGSSGQSPGTGGRERRDPRSRPFRLVGSLQGARREVRLQRGNRCRRSEEDAREIAETVRVRRQRFSSCRRSDLYIKCAGATARRGGFCFADSEIMPIFAVPSVKRGNVERFD